MAMVDNAQRTSRPTGNREAPGTALRALLISPQHGVEEVVDALYLKDETTARTELLARRTALAEQALPLSDEAREVLGLYLHWLDWQIVRAFDPLEARPAKQAELLEIFDRPVTTRLGNICRNKLALQLLVNQESPGKLTLDPERFRSLYGAIPQAERDSELNYYVASWAFRHRDLPVLEEAFEFFTIYADGMASDYNWQYANLMYQVLKGAAGRRDVHELLIRMTMPQELRQFERFILPELVRLDLLTENMQEEIEATRRRISALPLHRPAHELPTKRIGPSY